jgi:alpha/beta superfamily hydrolase
MEVRFACNEIELEGILSVPAHAARGAVVCHPHPQYGGDMHNAVVACLADTLEQLGHATLRFNFRGTGRSGGRHAGGEREGEDVLAAVAFLRREAPVREVTVAGYSFGAVVGLHAAWDAADVARLIAVAPPLAFFDLDFMVHCAKPKLFIAGDGDQFCDVAELRRNVAGLPEPKTLKILSGADHFLFGHERALGEAVRSFAAVEA